MDNHMRSDTPASIPTMQISLELGGLHRPSSPSLLLIYTLSGFSELTINDTRRLKQEAGSIHIINAGERYEITDMDNFAAVAFHIDIGQFTRSMPALAEKRFSTKAVSVDQDDYDALTILLSKSLKIFTSDSEESPILQSLIAHRIVLLLLKKFQVLKKYDAQMPKTNDAVIQKLMAYIEQHSAERLSLESLSAQVHLNPQYLSRLFRKETGMTLTHYIGQVRILASEKDVLYGGLRATEIAEKYGFANTKSFYSSFRAVFGKTPGQHKADMQKETSSHLNLRLRCPSPFLYTREMVKRFIDTRDDQSIFDPLSTVGPDLSSTDVLEYSIECATDEASEPFVHRWSLGSAPAPCTDTSSATPYVQMDFIRLFDCANGRRPCYYEDAHGHPRYDFSEIDQLMGTALSRQACPVIELFFMPLQLAKKPQAFYLCQGAMCPPGNMECWLSLVTALVRHLTMHFGAELLRSAYFSLWCDPTPAPCWQGSREEFFDFAARTVRAVKSVDRHLRVGMPKLSPESLSPEWLTAFKAALDRERVSLDFIGVTIPFLTSLSDVPPENRLPFDAGQGYLLTDADHPLRTAETCKRMLAQNGFSNTGFFLTSMRPTGLSADLTQRTCFLNAYIVKMLLELAPFADHINFASIEPLSPHSPIPPAHNVFSMLEKLGNRILRRGDRYIITSGEQGHYQVLCYNYCHYHKRFKTPRQLAALPLQNLYTAFERGDDIHLTVTLKNIYGQYRVRKYRLDAHYGSPFDAWLLLGAPDQLTSEELRHISSKAVPDYTTQAVNLDGEYTMYSSVSPHEVELFMLSPLE